MTTNPTTTTPLVVWCLTSSMAVCAEDMTTSDLFDQQHEKPRLFLTLADAKEAAEEDYALSGPDDFELSMVWESGTNADGEWHEYSPEDPDPEVCYVARVRPVTILPWSRPVS